MLHCCKNAKCLRLICSSIFCLQTSDLDITGALIKQAERIQKKCEFYIFFLIFNIKKQGKQQSPGNFLQNMMKRCENPYFQTVSVAVLPVERVVFPQILVFLKEIIQSRGTQNSFKQQEFIKQSISTLPRRVESRLSRKQKQSPCSG